MARVSPIRGAFVEEQIDVTWGRGSMTISRQNGYDVFGHM